MNQSKNFYQICYTRAPGQEGGGGTPYDSLFGEAPPERGTLFRLKVYERVGVLLVDVYKRVGNLSFGSVKAPKGLTDEFYGIKKSIKCSIFVIDSYLKDSTFTAVTRDARVPFVKRRHTMGTSSRRMVYNG